MAPPNLAARGWLDSSIVMGEYVVREVARGPSEGHWVLDLCSQLPIPRGGRWLSLGCGAGGAEMLIADRALAEHVVGIDASPEAIAGARAAARKLGATRVEFHVGDPSEISFDDYAVVLTSMTLFRTPCLAQFVERLHSALPPGGWLLSNEYVGPSQFQYSPRVLRIVDELLLLLPDRLRWDYVEGRRKEFQFVPPRSHFDAVAPTEATSSQLIEPILREHFARVERRDYGGTLLNPLLQHIVGNFDENDPEDAALLRLLVHLEVLLRREGGLASDFAVLAAVKNGR